MNKSGTASSVISHPKGGGAISGIGESFAPDLHTGTGNLTVPIALPPGRSGFAPQVSLVYSTGNGNGLFGLGWQLTVPGVTRDTSDRVPVYVDDDDVFLLSGMERLVPMGMRAAGETRYRPRTETSFARIVHRVHEHDDFWEVRTRDGHVSRYGHAGARGSDPATVRNPDDLRQVFAWSLTETSDPFGNRIQYAYERDAVYDDGPHRWDQIRLAQIRYADHGPRDDPRFLVTVDFVYENRPDPYSSYRAGFEIRNVRRCTRIEIRTHAGETRLARVYHFRYADSRLGPHDGVSLLRRIEVEGVDGEAREGLPPLDFDYTRFRPEQRVYQPVSAVGNALPERSLAHSDFELADLFGSGLPDIVQIGDAQRYWRNLGGGRFDVPRTLDGIPGIRLADRGVQLADADGDGHIDLLVSQRGLTGYMPLTVPESPRREPFVVYEATPPFDLEDLEVRLLDLDGDGGIDALRTGASFELYYHDRTLGWTTVESRARDRIDRFPNVHFSDPRVKLADMTGDGMTDIVLVDGQRVDYWPYLGHGRWGARVTMRGQLAFPDSQLYGGVGFDPRRVLLGDVDGDGVADLVYVESGRVTIWLNQSGNGWSEPIVIHGTPPITNVDAVRLVDLLGNGTAGILWSYDAGTFADSSYKFLDLTGGEKPYLLCERDNHAGARTRIEYAPSTSFYLADQSRPDTRWRGRLPFPVQVVARVEVIDELSGGKLTTEYRYHQGYWDGEEREFRGFGVVEQLDTEAFARYHAAGLHGGARFEPVDEVRFSPPTLTRTWFHQGEVQDAAGTRVEPELAGSFGDPAMFSRSQRGELAAIATATAQTSDPRRLRHALRALRGSVLRTELYALDDSSHRDRPYTVTESLNDVREIEPRDDAEWRVFFPFAVASRTTQWERGVEPMTRFSFTGAYDEYGLPQAQLDIAVPRGRDPLATLDVAGKSYLTTYAVSERARRDDNDRYIVDRVARTSRYEVRDDGTPSVFALRDVVNAGNADLRLIGHARTFFDGDAFVGLALGQLGDFGAPVRREALAFEDAFLANTLSPKYLDPNQTSWPAEYPAGFRDSLPAMAGYAHYRADGIAGSPGGYYVVTEQVRYDFQSGELPRGSVRESRDALGTATTIELDPYALFPARVIDAVGLATEATYDYRVLSPRVITDANGNATEAIYSPAGMVLAQYVRGKHGEGDATNPSIRFEYDLHAFDARSEPISVRTVRRIHHDSETDVDASERDQTIEVVEYSDGFGRILQSRAQAEDTLYGDPVFGGSGLPLDPSAPNAPAIAHVASDHVVVSGWQTYDNKGRVVEKYEPFFSSGWAYRAPADAERGQKAMLFYDPRGQLLRTLNPDASETLAVFGIPTDLADPTRFAPTPWESYAYDANDNAGRTHGVAASEYQSHWNTPSSVVVDALGRAITAVARNGPNPSTDWLTTHSTYDVQGHLVSLKDALGREAFRYTYDLSGRRWRVESIDAGRRDAVFDALGQSIESRDAKGALVLQAYDVLHRPARTWARDAVISPVQLRHVAAYGDEGTPAERAAAREDNLLGKLTSLHDGAGLVRHRAFDFKGNLVETSRRVIADAPILDVFAAAPTNGWEVTPFSADWEQSGLTLADVEAALLDAMVYETSATFDALGRARTVRLPRDVEDRRRVIRPTYNRAGSLEQVHLDDELYVGCIAYDAAARRVLVVYGNGTMTRHAYDPRTFLLARMRSERFTRPEATTYAPAGGVAQDFVYTYDLAGNILSITDRAPASGVLDNPDAANVDDPILAQLLATGDALIRRFTYYPVYRLRTATGRECDRPLENPPWLDEPRCTDLTRTRLYSERYTYDAAGSVLSLTHQGAGTGFTRAHDIESTSNRLRAVHLGPTTTIEYVFDPSGNTISESSSRHFEWNHADQLKSFRTQAAGAEPSVHAHYLYDGSGQRVKKLVRKQGGHIEVTHYIDGSFEHHRWVSNTSVGANNQVHVLDGTMRIALVRVGPAQPGDAAPPIQFELGDHLNSASVVLDASGAFINREDFSPYGETSFGSFAKKRYRFTGMERDEESSLSCHGARYLAPWLARWLSSDPAGPVGGANLYEYAASNPVAATDTGGMQPEVPLKMDSQGNYEVPGETIYVEGRAPLDDLGRAEAAGYIEVTSRADIERHARDEAQRDKSDRSWMRPPRDEWSATVDPEGARADAEAQFQHAVDLARQKHRAAKAAEWEASTRRMNTAASVGNGIGYGIGVGGCAIMAFAVIPTAPALVSGVKWGLRSAAMYAFLHHVLRHQQTGDPDEAGRAFVAGLGAFIPESPTASGPLLSGAGRAKPISLPAWKKITVEMPHIMERHTHGGALSAGRTLFPITMNERSILRAIREAYSTAEKIEIQGERIKLLGRGGGQKINMWFNTATRKIESAWPEV